MPDGGYGIDREDQIEIAKAFTDEVVERYGLQIDWCAAYVAARVAGATPREAAFAAYVEWDL